MQDKTLAIKTEFRINHYAGSVKYQIHGFIDKNRDSLYQDFKRLLYNSKNKYISDMWPEGSQNLTEITKRPQTVATRFKNSMIGLVNNLSAKDPFYVRCIKPNETKSSQIFDEEKVKTQVFYLGLLENVRVRRAGFAYRLTYEKFMNRYKLLSKKTWPNPKQGDIKDNSSIIINELNFDKDVRYGNTKIFIRSPQTVFSLETKRTERIPHIVTILQKNLRGTLARRYYKKLRAANKIALAYKHYKIRKYVYNLYNIYGQAKNRKDYGKSFQWPVCLRSMRKADDFLRKMYLRWRAFMVLKPYPPDLRSEIYLLSLSCEIIKKRPMPSNLTQKWKGDYLSNPIENPKSVLYNQAINELKKSYSIRRILFSSFVYKVFYYF